MFTAVVQLAVAGGDTGPTFNLFSNLDYGTPFETGVLKADLLAGYTTYFVPDGTTTIRVCSAGPSCFNCVDIDVSTTPPVETPINIVNNSGSPDDVEIALITMDNGVVVTLPPGPPLYPLALNSVLTSFANGTYDITVTLQETFTSNVSVHIDQGVTPIDCYTYPVGTSVSYTFSGIVLSGPTITITVDQLPCA